MKEQFYTCQVSILVDPSIREQRYIEDCERCCRPIEFRIITDGIQIIEFDYQGLAQ
ncbi:MAG: CPXCG motif-containing cysteine-rich protein [Vicingaceae bacterium]